ncbi:MAG: hypothetical protein ACREUW_18485 [Burkholderiales bacterium]
MTDTSIKEPKEKARQNQPQELPSEKQQQEKEFGEGNYKAAREYDQAAERFANSGKVESAAKAAAPASKAEADELQRAEARGRSKAKGGVAAGHKSKASPDA